MRVLFVLVLLVLLAGCSSTSLVGSWREPRYQGPPMSRILVIGVSEDGTMRRIFEGQFTRSLQERGLQALPSYNLIPEDGQVPEERIAEAVRQAGADGVLMTRTVKSETETAVLPGYTRTLVMPGPADHRPSTAHHGSLYGHYSSAWTTYVPPTVTEYQVLTLETDLWSVPRNERVWSGVTQTTEGGNINRNIDDVVEIITEALAEEDLI
jgi:hypothetical protein